MKQWDSCVMGWNGWNDVYKSSPLPRSQTVFGNRTSSEDVIISPVGGIKRRVAKLVAYARRP